MAPDAERAGRHGPVSPTGAGVADGSGPMHDDGALLDRARRVVRDEADALRDLETRMGEDFLTAVRLIGDAPGRVVVSGVGKSGIIGRKLAATLTSTGTPAVFLHPVESLHGDLGIVDRGDVLLLVSKSGESDELTGLVEYTSRLGNAIVALVGRRDSALARAATVVLDCGVQTEACPLDLAPTTSTTVTMALGDALAVALLLRGGFTREDFARLHPGGALGRKLTLRVRDVMITDECPRLGPDAAMRQCVVLLAERRGTVPIIDEDRRVLGVVTAGDLTRAMEDEANILAVPVSQVMNPSPKVTTPETLGATAIYQMETHGIMALPVVDAEKRLIGIVHLHDLMRAGAV